MAGLMPEIEQGCRTDAFDIRAFRSQREVKVQYTPAPETPFKLEGAQDIAQLAAPCMTVRGKEAACLHGQRGAARDNMTTPGQLPDGARKGLRINPRMAFKAVVFRHHQECDVGRVNIPAFNRQAPEAIAAYMAVKQCMVKGLHKKGGLLGPMQVWRIKTVGHQQTSRNEAGEQQAECTVSDEAEGSPQCAVISTVPDAVRAIRLGRRRALTSASGRVKRPGVMARTM